MARISRPYSLVLNVVGAVAAGLLAYALGARGEVLFISVCVGIFPMSFLVIWVSAQLFAPTLVATSEFRTILYDDGASADDAPLLSDEDRRVLRYVRVLMNAIVLIAFIALLASAAGLFRLERWVYNHISLLSGRSGPAAFPVTARIHDDGLDITNGSTAPWTCTVSIGARQIFSSSFTMEAAHTRFIAYKDFVAGAVPLAADDGYWKARESIVVECLERNGRSHFVAF